MNKLQEPVLVVDDEADIRDLMEMTLMKMGLRVDTAAGVEEAKDKLDNNDYSLVLTDMRMPRRLRPRGGPIHRRVDARHARRRDYGFRQCRPSR